MTVGNINLDSFTTISTGWIGVKGSQVWSGADEPRLPVVKATYYNIFREEVHPRTGKTFLRKYRVRQPGYRPKRTKHTEHNYTKSVQRLRQDRWTAPTGSVWPDMTLFADPLWSAETLLTANHQIKLVNKLSEKLKGSDFNMSVFLGEGRQTLALLADSAIRIRKAYLHVRRRDISGAARVLFEGTNRKPLGQHTWIKTRRDAFGVNRHGEVNAAELARYSAKGLSSLWLELQYGWLPLVKDAEECAKSLAHYLNPPFTNTYRSSVFQGKEYERIVPVGFGSTQNASVQTTKYHSRSIIAKISEPPSVVAQLGLLDPEVVIWELVPFSFVTDWFIPIGQWMEARANASRLIGTFITTNKRYAVCGPPSIGGKQTGGRYNQLLFDRVISTSLSVPMPEFKPLKEAASWLHCANAIALLTGLFTGNKVRS